MAQFLLPLCMRLRLLQRPRQALTLCFCISCIQRSTMEQHRVL
jgi:hypothetical protein